MCYCLNKSVRKNFFSTINSLPSTADVVIIGGGVSGCNTLYHLAKRNVKTVLVERGRVTCGTSWHSAGLVWGLRPNDVEIQLLNATKRVFQELGTGSSWTQNGGLYIAHTKERLQEYQRLNTIGKFFGVESEVLSSEDATKLFPLLKKDAFYAALFIPSDGAINPDSLCKSLIRRATLEGYGKIVENCPITNILTTSTTGIRKVTGVQTASGIIKTNYIVNSAGVWSNNLMNSIGIDLPILPIKNAYIVTEKISDLNDNVPNIQDYDSSLYFRVRNGSICIGGYDKNPDIMKEVPDYFKFDNLNLNGSTFNSYLEKAAKICPSLVNVGFTASHCGPESFTPDSKPILGMDPIIKGLFHNCGYNSAGIMLGGGCAEQLALSILQGAPDLHMSNFDIKRFTTLMRRESNWIHERVHETYQNTYRIVYPNDQPLSGRGLVTDVFHDNLITSGAFMEERNGWEKPGYFLKGNETARVPQYDWYGCYGVQKNGDDVNYLKWLKKNRTFGFSEVDEFVKDEVVHCRTRASIFDLSYFTKLYLTGPEASQAAEWLFTADINQFDAEDYVYTCMLNKNGNVEADLNVMTLNQGIGTLVGPILKGRGYYIVAGGKIGSNVIAHIKHEIHHKALKAVVTDVTNRMGILSIQGPKSREILQGVTETPITDNRFPLATSRLVSIDGEVCRAIRTSFIGELGFQLHIPVASSAPVYKKITEIGTHYQMKHAGFRALYVLNCEKGKHLWGSDLRNDDNPIEANLGHYCRREGNYLGKRTVDHLRHTGTSKFRVFLTIDDKVPMNGLETIWRDGVIVGYLRRAEYGYNLGKSIGIGYVEHPHKNILTEEYLNSGRYQIEIMGTKYDAKLHRQTVFDPQNLRIRGIYETSLNDCTQFHY